MLFTALQTEKEKKKINLQKLAEIVGLESKALSFSIQQKNIRYQVKHDISIGIKLGINGTPGYLIKDKVYVGAVPTGIIKSVLNWSTKKEATLFNFLFNANKSIQ